VSDGSHRNNQEALTVGAEMKIPAALSEPSGCFLPISSLKDGVVLDIIHSSKNTTRAESSHRTTLRQHTPGVCTVALWGALGAKKLTL
jgi:hypothetical protein